MQQVLPGGGTLHWAGVLQNLLRAQVDLDGPVLTLQVDLQGALLTTE